MKHAGALHSAIDDEAKNNPGWRVERSSCLGLCDRAPAALVGDQQAGALQPGDAARVMNGWRGENTDYATPRPG